MCPPGLASGGCGLHTATEVWATYIVLELACCLPGGLQNVHPVGGGVYTVLRSMIREDPKDVSAEKVCTTAVTGVCLTASYRRVCAIAGQELPAAADSQPLYKRGLVS